MLSRESSHLADRDGDTQIDANACVVMSGIIPDMGTSESPQRWWLGPVFWWEVIRASRRGLWHVGRFAFAASTLVLFSGAAILFWWSVGLMAKLRRGIDLGERRYFQESSHLVIIRDGAGECTNLRREIATLAPERLDFPDKGASFRHFSALSLA